MKLRHLTSFGLFCITIGIQSCLGLGDTPTLTVTVVTSKASSVTSTSAVTGGTIQANGNVTIVARGVVLSSGTATPTITDQLIASGNGLGTFSTTVTGLASNTTYYLRAYATTTAETTYGNVIIFVTQ